MLGKTVASESKNFFSQNESWYESFFAVLPYHYCLSQERLAGQWVEIQCTRDGSSLKVAAASKWKPDPLVQRTCSSLFDRKASQLVMETHEEEEIRKSIKHADRNVAILDASMDAPWAITPEKFTS